MTPEKAIELIQTMIKDNDEHDGIILGNGDKMALNLAIKALEKEIPVLPSYTILQYGTGDKVRRIKHPECPRCQKEGKVLWDASHDLYHIYCHRCGQKFNNKDYKKEIE